MPSRRTTLFRVPACWPPMGCTTRFSPKQECSRRSTPVALCASWATRRMPRSPRRSCGRNRRRCSHSGPAPTARAAGPVCKWRRTLRRPTGASRGAAGLPSTGAAALAQPAHTDTGATFSTPPRATRSGPRSSGSTWRPAGAGALSSPAAQPAWAWAPRVPRGLATTWWGASAPPTAAMPIAGASPTGRNSGAGCGRRSGCGGAWPAGSALQLRL
mmetsp:Transcript_35404/g.114058  ORF Transcript_35404/g.114058 Transcript_35404/m.114058 type:complete len:215 (+) Transcript_35404:249-893(+)